MKIVEVSIGRTFNLGNFESLRIDLRAEIDEEKENVQKCLEELDAECQEYLRSSKV